MRIGARLVAFALLLVFVGTGAVFGQSRESDSEPLTLEQEIQRITGYRPDVDRDVRPYHPRRMFNPQQSEMFRAINGDEAGPAGSWRGRSPFVVRDSDGGRIVLASPTGEGNGYAPVLDIDQYMLDFEFETPRWISVDQPDGSRETVWYMIFRAINWEPYPVNAHLSFHMKTMEQDLHPSPYPNPGSGENSIDDQLLRQFAGSEEGGELLGASGMARHRDEIVRGIRRSLVLDYLNYPDRSLLDRICTMERRWEEDRYGRLYNSLVPAHLFQWRKQLRVAGGYEYPQVIVLDWQNSDPRNKQVNAFVFDLQYVAPLGEANLRGDLPVAIDELDPDLRDSLSEARGNLRWEGEMSAGQYRRLRARDDSDSWRDAIDELYAEARRPREPQLQVRVCPWEGEPANMFRNPVPLADFLNGAVAANQYVDAADADRMVKVELESQWQPLPTGNARRRSTAAPTAEIMLAEALRRVLPVYQKGDRVDQYGFVLDTGHPDYERGVLLNSDYTILNRLFGARRDAIALGEGAWAGLQEVAGAVVMEPAVAGERASLPVLDRSNGGDLTLVAPVLDTLVDAALTLDMLTNGGENVPDDMAALWNEVGDKVGAVMNLYGSGNTPDAGPWHNALRALATALVGVWTDGNVNLPDVVEFDIDRLIVRPSRLAFAEAAVVPAAADDVDAVDRAIVIGRVDGTMLWEARFHPARCLVKRPAPRRYAEGDTTLRNYHLPLQPRWTVPGDPEWGANLYRPIGAENPVDHRHYVNGVILDDYEHGNAGVAEPTLPAPTVNRYGEANGRNYNGATIAVDDSEPFMDNRWNRDGAGVYRPVKRVDHLGRAMTAGWRYYQPGDRVTQLEWEAYGALVPVNVLRDYELRGGYPAAGEPFREYLRHGDLLVGQPRLMLCEFKYRAVRSAIDEWVLEPIGSLVDGPDGTRIPPGPTQVVMEDGAYWRFGFRCDAAGCYDAIVYEEIDPDHQGRFNTMVQATVDLQTAMADYHRAVQEAMREGEEIPPVPEALDPQTVDDGEYLMLVPVMGPRGAGQPWVHPLTDEKMPLRDPVLPSSEEELRFVRDTGGNVVFAKDWEKLPRYLYEYDYAGISSTMAGAPVEDLDIAAANQRISAITRPGDGRNQAQTLEFDVDEFRDAVVAAAERNAALEPGEREEDLPGPDAYWDRESYEVPYANEMAGLYRTADRPTLGAAQILDYRDVDGDGYKLLIEKSYIMGIVEKNEDDELLPDAREFDRVVVTSARGVSRLVTVNEDGRQRTRAVRDETWTWPHVAYLGEVLEDEERPHAIVMRVSREIRPAVAEGVAVFGELDRQWDFMNVYVYGIKGPLRRNGLNPVRFQGNGAPAPAPGGGSTREYSPRLVREDWILMLRFERPGDEFNVEADPVRFVRKYWYLSRDQEQFAIRGGR